MIQSSLEKGYSSVCGLKRTTKTNRISGVDGYTSIIRFFNWRFIAGKSSINGKFIIAMFDYRRVFTRILGICQFTHSQLGQLHISRMEVDLGDVSRCGSSCKSIFQVIKIH